MELARALADAAHGGQVLMTEEAWHGVQELLQVCAPHRHLGRASVICISTQPATAANMAHCMFSGVRASPEQP